MAKPRGRKNASKGLARKEKKRVAHIKASHLTPETTCQSQPADKASSKEPSTEASGGDTPRTKIYQRALDRCDKIGKGMFTKGNYEQAKKAYSMAIDECEPYLRESGYEFSALRVKCLSNISACHFQDADQPRGMELAKQHAKKVVDLAKEGHPEWLGRGVSRLVKASLTLGHFDDAYKGVEYGQKHCPQDADWDSLKSDVELAEKNGKIPPRSQVPYVAPKNHSDLQSNFNIESCTQFPNRTPGTFQWAFSKPLCPLPPLSVQGFQMLAGVSWNSLDELPSHGHFWQPWLKDWRKPNTMCQDDAPDIRTMDALSFIITPARMLCALGLQSAKSWKGGELHLVVVGATKFAEERFARYPNIKSTKECDCYWAEFCIILKAAAAVHGEQAPKVHLHLVGPEVSCTTHWKDPNSALASVTCCKMEPPTICNYLHDNRDKLTPANTCITIMNPGFGNWNDPATAKWDLVWSYIGDLAYATEKQFLVLGTACHKIDMVGEICVWEGALNAKVVKKPLENVSSACTEIQGDGAGTNPTNIPTNPKKDKKSSKSKSKSRSPKHQTSHSSNENPCWSDETGSPESTPTRPDPPPPPPAPPPKINNSFRANMWCYAVQGHYEHTKEQNDMLDILRKHCFPDKRLGDGRKQLPTIFTAAAQRVIKARHSKWRKKDETKLDICDVVVPANHISSSSSSTEKRSEETETSEKVAKSDKNEEKSAAGSTTGEKESASAGGSSGGTSAQSKVSSETTQSKSTDNNVDVGAVSEKDAQSEDRFESVDKSEEKDTSDKSGSGQGSQGTMGASSGGESAEFKDARSVASNARSQSAKSDNDKFEDTMSQPDVSAGGLPLPLGRENSPDMAPPPCPPLDADGTDDLCDKFEKVSLGKTSQEEDDAISELPWERHHAIYGKVSKRYVTFDVYVPPLKGQRQDDAFIVQWGSSHRCYIHSIDDNEDGLPAQSLALTFPRLIDQSTAEVTWDSEKAHLRMQVDRVKGDRSANWQAYKIKMISEHGPDIVGDLHTPRSMEPAASLF